MSKVLIGLAVTLLAVTGCTYSMDNTGQPTDTQSNGYFYYYNNSDVKDYSFQDYDIDIDLS